MTSAAHAAVSFKETFMSKTIAWILCAAALVVATAQGVTAFLALRSHAAPELSAPYHAVALNNGQVYFGRIDALGTDYTIVRDVFYIHSRVVNQDTKQVANILVKRGGEWHAPDRMIVSRSQILLIEPVTEDSQVAKLIAEQNKPAH